MQGLTLRVLFVCISVLGSNGLPMKVISNKHEKVAKAEEKMGFVDTTEEVRLSYRTYNASCTLRLEDGSFPELISRYKDEGYGLIFFYLQIEDELSESINDSLILPTQWIWATEHFGSNMLLLKQQLVDTVIFRHFGLGIYEKTVNIKSEPKACLPGIRNTSVYEEMVLNMFLPINLTTDVDLYQSDRICKLNMRKYKYMYANTQDTFELYYNCFMITQGEERFTQFELVAGRLFQTILIFLILTLIVAIYISVFLLLSVPFFGMKNKDMKANVARNCRNDYRYSKIEFQRFITETKDSFSFLIWMYEKVLLCKIYKIQPVSSSFRSILTSRIMPCCNHRMFSCLKILNICICFFLWIMVFVLYILFTLNTQDKETIIINDFCRRQGYETDSNATILFLCGMCIFSNSLFVPIYFIIMNKIGREYEEMEKELSLKLKANLESYNQLLTNENYSCVICRCVIVLLEPFVHCLAKIRRMNCFYLGYLIDKNVHNKRKKKVLVFSYSLLVGFIIGPVFPILTMIILWKFIVDFTFTTLIVIINFQDYRGYALTAFSVLFYALNCIRNLELRYQSCYQTLYKYVKHKIISRVISKTKRKKYFTVLLNISTNMKRVHCRVSELVENKGLYSLKIGDSTSVLFDEGKILISRLSFERIISRKGKGFPGPPLLIITLLFMKLILLAIFIITLFVITQTFGNENYGSNAAQATITIATSVLPWLVGDKLLQTESTKLDIEDEEVQKIIFQVISSAEEQSDDGESSPGSDERSPIIQC